MAECLVLGPEGAGKTLLVRKIEEYCRKKKGASDATVAAASPVESYAGISSKPNHYTLPTVGINFSKVKLAKGVSCSLRESGGQMVPLWCNSYQDCKMVIYVIDSSNQAQVSASTILLLQVLSSEALQKKPVLLFFNKTDSPLGLGLVEYKSVMRLDDILLHASQSIAVVSGSCWTGDGVGAIVEWLLEHCKAG